MSFRHVLGNREPELIREAPLHLPHPPGAAVRSLAALLCREHPLPAKCHGGQAGHRPGSPTSLSVAVFPTLFFSLPHAYKIMGCPAVLVGATGREKVGTRWRTGRAPSFRSQPLFSTQKTLFITETIPDPEDLAESRLSPKPSWLGLYIPQTLTAPSESPSSHQGAPRSLPMQAPYACSLPLSFFSTHFWMTLSPSFFSPHLSHPTPFYFFMRCCKRKGRIWIQLISRMLLLSSAHIYTPPRPHCPKKRAAVGRGAFPRASRHFLPKPWSNSSF